MTTDVSNTSHDWQPGQCFYGMDPGYCSRCKLDHTKENAEEPCAGSPHVASMPDAAWFEWTGQGIHERD